MLLEQRPRSTHRQRIDDRFAHQSSFHFSVWPKATAQQAKGEKKSDPVVANSGKDRIDDLFTPPPSRHRRNGRDKPIYPAPTVRSLHLRRRQSRSRREKTSSLLGKRRPPAPSRHRRKGAENPILEDSRTRLFSTTSRGGLVLLRKTSPFD